jgi:hypothetical protein
MRKAVENNEPSTTRYQFFLNDDQTQCVVNESYVNLEAALAHLKGVASQTILPKIFDACKVNRFELYGEINDDLRKARELPSSNWLFSVTAYRQNIIQY